VLFLSSQQTVGVSHHPPPPQNHPSRVPLPTPPPMQGAVALPRFSFSGLCVPKVLLSALPCSFLFADISPRWTNPPPSPMAPSLSIGKIGRQPCVRGDQEPLSTPLFRRFFNFFPPPPHNRVGFFFFFFAPPPPARPPPVPFFCEPAFQLFHSWCLMRCLSWYSFFFSFFLFPSCLFDFSSLRFFFSLSVAGTRLSRAFAIIP